MLAEECDSDIRRSETQRLGGVGGGGALGKIMKLS